MSDSTRSGNGQPLPSNSANVPLDAGAPYGSGHNERPVSQEETFEILRYLRILLIHKWIFMGVFFLILLIGVIYAIRQPKYYEVQYEVFFNESLKEFILKSDVPVIRSEFDKNFWLSTMNSEEIARLTLENSKLAYTSAIIRRMIKAEIKDKRNVDETVFLVTITSKQNNIIPILINAYVKSLNDLLQRHQVSNSHKLVHYLQGQLSDNDAKLAAIDEQIISRSAGSPGTIRDSKKLSANLDLFRTDLLNTQINLNSTAASRDRTERELKHLDGTIVNESAFSEPLKVQLMNLQVDLARSLTKNTEDHPAIKGIRDNIFQITQLLRDSIQQKLEIKSLVQNPLKLQLMSKLMDLEITEISLRTRVLSLQKVINEFEGQMLPDTTDENCEQLLRNRELVSMTIHLLNSKLIEAQTAAQGSLSRFVLIDEPEVPTVTANKSLMIILLAAIMAAFVLAGAAVFVYDLLDNRILLMDDYIQYFPSIPILGMLSHKKCPEECYSTFNNPALLNETGEIVVNIKKSIREKQHKLISICSPMRKEGKSMVSLQVASALANKGLKVLLVDMDMFIPKLTLKMGREAGAGLINYIEGSSTFEDMVFSTENSMLEFVGTGSNSNERPFNYDDPSFIRFYHEARSRYDVVIFDTPAVLYIPDIVTFMDHMDGIIIVARLMHTTRRSLDHMVKLVGHHRSRFIGTIINDLQIGPLSRYDYRYHEYATDYMDKSVSKKNKTA